ncbi:transposase, MuDR, MULE transposase domain protein, partial [Tanacetum coccineum]
MMFVVRISASSVISKACNPCTTIDVLVFPQLESPFVILKQLLDVPQFLHKPCSMLMSTQDYMQKVVEGVGEDADFNSGAWVSATNYVNAFGGTSCSPNALGDLNVTLKDLSGTVPGTINYKVLDVGSYEKDITVGAAMILVNVSVFTPKPSKHYLNITKRNVVELRRLSDTVKPSSLPYWKLKEVFATCIILGGYLPLMMDNEGYQFSSDLLVLNLSWKKRYHW